jgi:hypothetical protein
VYDDVAPAPTPEVRAAQLPPVDGQVDVPPVDVPVEVPADGPAPAADMTAISALEAELGAIEAELHALDGTHTDPA